VKPVPPASVPAELEARSDAHALAALRMGSKTCRADCPDHDQLISRAAPNTLAVDAFAAALVALVHTVAGWNPAGDYDIILGVEAATPPEFHERNAATPTGVHRSLSGRFRPVHATVDPSVNDTQFIRAAIDLATSALSQVGINKPTNRDTRLPPRPTNWTW
jgi:hypothetical protein